MAVGTNTLPKLLPVAGVRLAVVSAGVRYKNRDDVVLITADSGSSCAGVFTQNAFCAAPVVVAKKHMQQMAARALLINSGNANAGTGEAGMQAAEQTCEAMAKALAIPKEAVLPFSTGVIGENLPSDKIIAVMPDLVQQLTADLWEKAAYAIMTTDTIPKGVSTQISIQGKTVTLTGIAKGSGMIRPDMATMLAYIATDIEMEEPLLQQCLEKAVNSSFNRITVDGDTSTNDACMLIASGQSAVKLSDNDGDLEIFTEALNALCQQLATLIIRDGEGATKFITIEVQQGNSTEECLQVAYTIAHSPLVKTAFFASDPNWGRILAAVGRAGLDNLSIDNISIYLGDVCIVEQGQRAQSYTEEQGQAVMNEEEITIKVLLGRGNNSETVWTSDLSYDYVKINAEYRS